MLRAKLTTLVYGDRGVLDLELGDLGESAGDPGTRFSEVRRSKHYAYYELEGDPRGFAALVVAVLRKLLEFSRRRVDELLDPVLIAKAAPGWVRIRALRAYESGEGLVYLPFADAQLVFRGYDDARTAVSNAVHEIGEITRSRFRAPGAERRVAELRSAIERLFHPFEEFLRGLHAGVSEVISGLARGEPRVFEVVTKERSALVRSSIYVYASPDPRLAGRVLRLDNHSECEYILVAPGGELLVPKGFYDEVESTYVARIERSALSVAYLRALSGFEAAELWGEDLYEWEDAIEVGINVGVLRYLERFNEFFRIVIAAAVSVSMVREELLVVEVLDERLGSEGGIVVRFIDPEDEYYEEHAPRVTIPTSDIFRGRGIAKLTRFLAESGILALRTLSSGEQRVVRRSLA